MIWESTVSFFTSGIAAFALIISISITYAVTSIKWADDNEM